MVVEAISNFVTDWLEKAIIKPDFLFSYYGFEWVKPLPDVGMYMVNGILLLAAIGMVLGWRYRLSCLLATLIYAYLFLLAKSYYLNHAYLIILISFWMIWLPANRAFSLDVWQGRVVPTSQALRWHLFLLRFHMGIVYFFGGIAKLNPDWLFRAQPLQIWLKGKGNILLVGDLVTQQWFAYFLGMGRHVVRFTHRFFTPFCTAQIAGLLLGIVFSCHQ